MHHHAPDPVDTVVQSLPAPLLHHLVERSGIPAQTRDMIREQLRQRSLGQLLERIHRRWFAGPAHLRWSELAKACEQIAIALIAPSDCPDPACEDGFLDDDRLCRICHPLKPFQPATVDWRPTPACTSTRIPARPLSAQVPEPTSTYRPAPYTLREPEDAWPPPPPDSVVLRERAARNPRYQREAVRRAREDAARNAKS